MTEPKAPPSRRAPDRTPQAEAERAARQAREAEALRRNLLRRKQQARARAESVPPRTED